MELSKEDLLHIAKLAALEVSDAEIDKLKEDVVSILDFVAQLGEVNTDGVLPTSHVHGAVNAFRDDISKDSLSSEEALKNAPETSRDSFRVPRII